MPQIGSPAPEFTLPNQQRQPMSVDDLRGRKSLIVFIPFPFTGVCTGEVCEIQDNLGQLRDLDANVVVITCATVATNAKWSELEGLEFPVLSDYWPHGVVSQAYETFDDRTGAARRSTFVLDETATITHVFATDRLSVARDYDDYVAALSAG